MTQPTARPWRISEGGSKPNHSQLFFEGAYKEEYVGEVLTINAPLILKSVNLHDELVGALKEAIALITKKYCSHSGPCSAENKYCYAENQLKALAKAQEEA